MEYKDVQPTLNIHSQKTGSCLVIFRDFGTGENSRDPLSPTRALPLNIHLTFLVDLCPFHEGQSMKFGQFDHS